MKTLQRLEIAIENNQEINLCEKDIINLRGTRLSEISDTVRYYLEDAGFIDDSKLYNDEEEFIGDSEEFMLIEGGSRAPLMWITEGEYRYSGRTIELLDSVRKHVRNEDTLKWVNSNLRKYLLKGGIESVERNEVEHIIHFLDSKDSPENINKMSYDEALEGSKRWTQTLNTRANKEEGEVEEITSIDGFIFYKLLDIQACNREGYMMKNCIADYGDEVESGETTIYSMRNSNNKPHVSFEVRGGELIQVYGPGNSIIKAKYQLPAIKFIEQLGCEADEDVLRNLGLVSEINENLKLFLSETPQKIFGMHWVGGVELVMPEECIIEGNLDLRGTRVKELPKKLKVGGSFYLEGTNITTLPNNLEVGLDLCLEDTQITVLPAYLQVGAHLQLSGSQITTLPEDLRVGGDLCLEETQITTLPSDLSVGGGLYLDNTQITTLPSGLSVGGGLWLSGTQIKTLPSDLKAGGNLDLSDTQITTLPSGLSVGGSLFLSGTQITTLPSDLSVGGGLYLSGTQITTLPAGLSVEGNLDLSDTQIISFPRGLKVKGNLDLSGTQITTLPSGLKVKGDLGLMGTQITELPEGLSVGRSLDLENTQITTLPSDLSVGGDLDLENTQITTLPSDLIIGGHLVLRGTQITNLPEDLRVEYTIYGFQGDKEKYKDKYDFKD